MYIITPFGFEFLESNSWKDKYVRNLFAYVYILPTVAEADARMEYKRALMRVLQRRHSDAAANIFYASDPPPDRGATECDHLLVYWKFRRASGHAPIIEYADFIISSPIAIANGCLKCSHKFNEDLLSLRYLCQLYLISATLAGRFYRINIDDEVYRRSLDICANLSE